MRKFSFLLLNLTAFITNGYAASSITWQPCADDPSFLCGTLEVPEDYKNPDQATLQLPVAMHPASGNKLGTLVMNFGGPWYDDSQSIRELFPLLSKNIQDNFDIVSFAPRGAAPNAIMCHSNDMDKIHELERQENLTDTNTPAGAKAYYDLTLQQHAMCDYDPLYQYAGTKNTIQDLDQLRQVLGEDKINYFGASYGTRLGLAYLITYPEHINNAVLDANVEPTNDYASFAADVASASEATLSAFFNFCYAAGKQCTLYQNSPQQIQTVYQNLVSMAGTSGIPTTATYSNRPLSATMLQNLVNNDLGDNSTWSNLAAELNQAVIKNNADALMKEYVQASGYSPIDNTYKKYDDRGTFDAVICKDFSIPTSLTGESNWLETMSILRVKNPLAGGMEGASFARACIKWPAPSEPLLPDDPQPVESAHPNVLIVSNTFDPITPPESAQKESDYLSKLNVTNKILTWKGAGHIAYHTSSPEGGCVDTNIDQFLISGVFPVTDTCDDAINPFEESNISSNRMHFNFMSQSRLKAIS